MPQKLQMLFTLISLTFLPFACTACIAQEKRHIGGPYYFESFANYKIPFQPIKELSKDEAKTRDAYYIAYYNEDGKIVSFSKYLNGKMEFDDKYFYGADGRIEKRELLKSSGERAIHYFDKEGNIIPG